MEFGVHSCWVELYFLATFSNKDDQIENQQDFAEDCRLRLNINKFKRKKKHRN